MSKFEEMASQSSFCEINVTQAIIIVPRFVPLCPISLTVYFYLYRNSGSCPRMPGRPGYNNTTRFLFSRSKYFSKFSPLKIFTLKILPLVCCWEFSFCFFWVILIFSLTCFLQHKFMVFKFWSVILFAPSPLPLVL